MTHEEVKRAQGAFDSHSEGPSGDAMPLWVPESLRKVEAPSRRLSAVDLAGLLDRAKTLAGTVTRRIEAAVTEASRIDTRWTPEARRQAEDEIKAKARQEADAHLAELREIVGQAEGQRALYSPAVLARAAVFDADPMREAALRQSWSLRAAGSDAEGLQALALLAATTGSVALGVVVADALRQRSDVGPGDRRAILDLVPRPAPSGELATVEAVREAWQSAEWQVQELGRPGSTRTSRVAAAFAGRAA